MERKRVAIMLELHWPQKRHSAIFAGTQQYALAHAWHTVIDEFADDSLLFKRRKAAPYDGVIARANPQLAERAAQWGVPVVNVWSSSPVRKLVPGVYPDATEIGRLGAEHLLSRGFYNFATVTSPRNVLEERAVKEFSRIVAREGHTFTSAKVPQSPEHDLASWRKTKQLIERLIDNWQLPVGVYVGAEQIGRLLVQMCYSRGLRVPEDVSIIAGQNQETLCEHPRPSLTSIELGYERIGYEAAKLLDGLMEGAPPPQEPILLPPQGLVVRESTDFFAVKDETVAAALAFISANSHRPIGQNDVALAVDVETRTLQNYFRKFLDRPIATEIRRVRIERAKRELAHGQRPLAEIARDVGFGDVQRMCEVFRRVEGVTPSEYRRQRQPKQET